MTVGIAGGLWSSLSLGDVVVAKRIYSYQGGRSDADGFHSHPRSWELRQEIEYPARALIRNKDWTQLLPDPDAAATFRVHVEPIAVGDVVLNSPDSPLAKQIRHHFNDAAAVEMESSGVAHASHVNLGLPMVAVRGISDSTHDKNITDAEGWQAVAATNAAAFAVALAARLPQPAKAKEPRRDESARTGEDAKYHQSTHVDKLHSMGSGPLIVGPIIGKE